MVRRKPARPEAYIPPPPDTSRDRSWERRQRGKAGYVTVTYRDIPDELRDAIKGIASEHLITVNEAARALMEAGLEEYRSGRLVLKPKLKIGRHTLYPEESDS